MFKLFNIVLLVVSFDHGHYSLDTAFHTAGGGIQYACKTAQLPEEHSAACSSSTLHCTAYRTNRTRFHASSKSCMLPTSVTLSPSCVALAALLVPTCELCGRRSAPNTTYPVHMQYTCSTPCGRHSRHMDTGFRSAQPGERSLTKTTSSTRQLSYLKSPVQHAHTAHRVAPRDAADAMPPPNHAGCLHRQSHCHPPALRHRWYLSA